jgi:hypothetical protein
VFPSNGAASVSVAAPSSDPPLGVKLPEPHRPRFLPPGAHAEYRVRSEASTGCAPLIVVSQQHPTFGAWRGEGGVEDRART